MEGKKINLFDVVRGKDLDTIRTLTLLGKTDRLAFKEILRKYKDSQKNLSYFVYDLENLLYFTSFSMMYEEYKKQYLDDNISLAWEGMFGHCAATIGYCLRDYFKKDIVDWNEDLEHPNISLFNWAGYEFCNMGNYLSKLGYHGLIITQSREIPLNRYEHLLSLELIRELDKTITIFIDLAFKYIGITLKNPKYVVDVILERPEIEKYWRYTNDMINYNRKLDKMSADILQRPSTDQITEECKEGILHAKKIREILNLYAAKLS